MYSYTFFMYAVEFFFSLPGEAVLYNWQTQSIFDLHIALCSLFIVSGLLLTFYLLPLLQLLLFLPLLLLLLYQYSLPRQSAVRGHPQELGSSLQCMIWFLTVIFICFLFLFLNMFSVLLVEKISPLSTPYGLVATLWFLVVIYTARLSAKSDPFTSISVLSEYH